MDSSVSPTHGNQEGTAYNGYFQRTCYHHYLALPKIVKEWSLRTLRAELIKIGAKVVKHARYVTFPRVEVLVSQRLFEEILERIHPSKPVPIGYGYAKNC